MNVSPSQAVTAPETARTFRARPIYRFLYKRLYLPRGLVQGGLSAAKRMFVRDQVRERARIARELSAPTHARIHLDEDAGFLRFESGDVPGAHETAARCRAIFEDYRASGRAEEEFQRNPNKRFLLSILSGNEFHEHPELMRFMVAREFVEAASRYLGTVPVVEGAALWWTPPNDSLKSSQQVHIDELARRQVKVIMNCHETTAENGPLHLVPAAISDDLRRRGRHRRGRLDDAWLEEPRAAGQLHAATGGPGSGVIFDSSRCLHFGSRGNRADRLVLTFHYLPLDAPTETRYHVDPPPILDADESLAPIQRLALGYRHG